MLGFFFVGGWGFSIGGGDVSGGGWAVPAEEVGLKEKQLD